MGQYVLNPSTPCCCGRRLRAGGLGPETRGIGPPAFGSERHGPRRPAAPPSIGRTLPEIQKLADGMTADAVADLLCSLADAGVVTNPARSHSRAVSIRIHGRGPLSDLLAGALRCRRASPTAAAPRRRAERADRPGGANGFPRVRPGVVRDLHAAARAAPSRAGARRHRSGRAASRSRGDQLSRLCGSAPQRPRCRMAGRGGAVARHRRQRRPGHGAGDRSVALNQVDRVIRAVRCGPGAAAHAEPPHAGHHAGVRRHIGSIVARRWSRHPRRTC